MCTLYAHTVSHTTYDESLASQCSNLCFHVIQDMQAYIGKEGITIKLGGGQTSQYRFQDFEDLPDKFPFDVHLWRSTDYRVQL